MTQQQTDPKPRVRCPKCYKVYEMTVTDIPGDTYCPGCGMLLKLQVAYIPELAKQLSMAAAA